MRRINLFLVLTLISLVSLVVIVAAGYIVLAAPSSSSSNNSNWMGQMMSGFGSMMSGTGNTQTQVQNSAAPWFGVAFVALISVGVVGICGLAYFYAFPEIRSINAVTKSPEVTNAPVVSTSIPSAMISQTEATPYASVLKTLTPDERKVIEVLKAHDGKYLQKYIRNESTFSRLKTHRIVARLADRGIVSLEKTGNTNTVMLATWLK
jgi:hypothetical protein